MDNTTLKSKRGRKPLYKKENTITILLAMLFKIYNKKYIIYLNNCTGLIELYIRVSDTMETLTSEMVYGLYQNKRNRFEITIITELDNNLDILNKFAIQFYKFYKKFSDEDEDIEMLIFARDYNNMIKDNDNYESYYNNVKETLTLNIFG